MSKKLEQKQARREAEERRKAEQRKQAIRRNALTIGSAVLVGAIVVVAIFIQREQGGGPVPNNVGVPASEAGCTDVEEFEEQGADHIAVGSQHEPYNSSPPTSGPHYETPAGTEFFAEQIPPEQLVHNLEHGQIVIWYSPDASNETRGHIEDLVTQQPTATAAAPYPDLASPYQLVLTAWGASQSCEQVSQEVVDDFRREYQGQGPEPLTPPFEG